MTASLNKVMVIGSVGRPAEMRYMPSGRPVTCFSVGATRSWNSEDGQEQEETEWFHVVAWGDLAERCKRSLRENHQVYIEGRLQTRSWETEDGGIQFRTELVASDMILLGQPAADGDHSSPSVDEW